jgi:hypothetical protein
MGPPDGIVRQILESRDLNNLAQQAAQFAGLCPNGAELRNLTPAGQLRLGLAYALEHPAGPGDLDQGPARPWAEQ